MEMKKMVLPASYTVMSDDEMTYTDGGFLADLAIGVYGIYTYATAITACRNWYKANKASTTTKTIDKALAAASTYIKGGNDMLDKMNRVFQYTCVVALAPLSALIVTL